jgi:hypothetical protein
LWIVAAIIFMLPIVFMLRASKQGAGAPPPMAE